VASLESIHEPLKKRSHYSLSTGNLGPPPHADTTIINNWNGLRRDVIARLRASPPLFEQLRKGELTKRTLISPCACGHGVPPSPLSGATEDKSPPVPRGSKLSG